MPGSTPLDRYHDFELHVERGAEQRVGTRGHQVDLRLCADDSAGRVETAGRLDLAAARQYMAEFATSGKSSHARAAKVLRQAILPDGSLLDRFHEAIERARRDRAGLRLRLEIDDPELARLPWELGSIPKWADGVPREPVFLVRHPGLSVVRQSGSAATDAGPGGGHRAPAAAHPFDARGTVLLTTALTVEGTFTDDAGRAFAVRAIDGGSAAETKRSARGLDRGPFEVEPSPEPLTVPALRAALTESVWCFYFGGHGRRDGIVLAGPGGAADPVLLPAADLAQLLAKARVAVAVLASCGTADPAPHAGPDPDPRADDEWHSLAETLVRAGVPYVIGMRGPIPNSTARDFTTALFDGLADYSRIDRAVAAARAALSHGWWLPVVHTCRDRTDLRVAATPSTPAPPAPAAPDTPRAYHVPPDWEPGDSRTVPGDSHPARIDVLWGLDRGPIRGVLADATGTDLAAELWSVETGPLWKYTVRGVEPEPADEWFPRRRWFTIRDGRHELPRSVGGLADLLFSTDGLAAHLDLHDGGGSPIGLVVRYEAETGDPRSPGRAAEDRVVELAAEAARFLPHAALVVHVRAGNPLDALTAAVRIGGRLPAECADGSAISVTILTRVLPGAAPAPATVRPPAAALTNREKVQLLDAHGERALDAPASPVDAEALEIVQGFKESTRTWRKEIELLLNVRNQLVEPGLHHALLWHLARLRTGPARYASLAVAAARDTDLDIWLSAAESAGRPVDPVAIPLRLLSQEALDAVVLALLRRADGPAAVRAAAGPWRNRASRAVREVADHLGDERRDNWTGVQRSADDLRFLLGRCDPLAAAVALRAGAGRGRTVRELSPDGLPTPAAWAVLARRCLDEVTVALIAGWPMSLRRVVGFAPDRAEPDAEVTDRLAVYHEALRPVFPPPRPW